jgi:hypothetical protein
MRRFLWKWVAVSVREENQKLAHLFMICSNIKLTATKESIELAMPAIWQENQRDPRMCRSIELLRFTRN